MKTRVFSLQDQRSFADLSGDHNPLHVDPVAARRLLFGGAVAHGIHLLLWALDVWLDGHTGRRALRSVTAKFPKPVGLDRAVEFCLVSENDRHVKIKLLDDGAMAAIIDFDWAPAEDAPIDAPGLARPADRPCRTRTAADLPGAAGAMRVELDVPSLARLLPNVAARLPLRQVAQLVTTSRLVGMECPGLHSVYAKLHVEFEPGAAAADGLRFAVVQFDERFFAVTMNVEAAGMRGTVNAFLRPLPTEQPGSRSLKGLVRAGEFQGQRALIIGGSRGIGEVAAKLLAAGGAEVQLTYRQGKQEAQAVVGDILAGGGVAAAFAYDVLDPQDTFARQLGESWRPTHLYFFATPFIFVPSRWPHAFSQTYFQRFCDYYVTGFARTVIAARKVSSELQHVFYPSSVAIDEMPDAMAEYVAAKSAGEALCDCLQRHLRQVAIYKPRLPRVATDQVASLLPAENEDTVATMIGHLRRFRDSRNP